MNYYEHQNWVQMNNLGFHDHDRAASNANYRILFLGDSFLEGRQVKTENLFTVRLEKKFDADGQRIETINGGVIGTGTAYQYVLWKEFFEPNIKIDHVVLCVFMGNDLVDNNLDLRVAIDPDGDDASFFLDSQGNISYRGQSRGLFKKGVNWARDYSALFNTLYEGAYRMKRSFPVSIGFASLSNTASEEARENTAGPWEASEQGTITLLRKWKSELAEKNTGFDIVVIDRPGKVYNKFELEFLDRLQATCAQHQIDCLRLGLGGDPYEAYSFNGIDLGHFSDRGHELAANELYDYFKSHHGEIFNRTTK